MRRRAGHLALAVAVVALLAITFAIGAARSSGTEQPFSGADAQATALVEADHPAYEPWVEPFFRPGSAEVESGLFAAQAAIGGLVVGYVVGRLRERRGASRASRA